MASSFCRRRGSQSPTMAGGITDTGEPYSPFVSTVQKACVYSRLFKVADVFNIPEFGEPCWSVDFSETSKFKVQSLFPVSCIESYANHGSVEAADHYVC